MAVAATFYDCRRWGCCLSGGVPCFALIIFHFESKFKMCYSLLKIKNNTHSVVSASFSLFIVFLSLSIYLFLHAKISLGVLHCLTVKYDNKLSIVYVPLTKCAFDAGPKFFYFLAECFIKFWIRTHSEIHTQVINTKVTHPKNICQQQPPQ